MLELKKTIEERIEAVDKKFVMTVCGSFRRGTYVRTVQSQCNKIAYSECLSRYFASPSKRCMLLYSMYSIYIVNI